MKKFMRGVMKMPLFWQGWLVLLVLINGVCPFFFLSENIAIITIAAMLAGSLLGFVLTEVHGFTKLLGLMHGPWVPLFAMQILILIKEEPSGHFQIWLWASFIVTLVSLVIDVIDVISYLKGNRTDLLKE